MEFDGTRLSSWWHVHVEHYNCANNSTKAWGNRGGGESLSSLVNLTGEEVCVAKINGLKHILVLKSDEFLNSLCNCLHIDGQPTNRTERHHNEQLSRSTHEMARLKIEFTEIPHLSLFTEYHIWVCSEFPDISLTIYLLRVKNLPLCILS